MESICRVSIRIFLCSIQSYGGIQRNSFLRLMMVGVVPFRATTILNTVLSIHGLILLIPSWLRLDLLTLLRETILSPMPASVSEPVLTPSMDYPLLPLTYWVVSGRIRLKPIPISEPMRIVSVLHPILLRLWVRRRMVETNR